MRNGLRPGRCVNATAGATLPRLCPIPAAFCSQNKIWTGRIAGPASHAEAKLDRLLRAGPPSRRTRQPADGRCPGIGPVAHLLAFSGGLGEIGLIQGLYSDAEAFSELNYPFSLADAMTPSGRKTINRGKIMKNIITLGAAALALAACAPSDAPADDTPVVEETTVIEESASDAADAATEAANEAAAAASDAADAATEAADEAMDAAEQAAADAADAADDAADATAEAMSDEDPQ